MKTKILADFQIRISVPLRWIPSNQMAVFTIFFKRLIFFKYRYQYIYLMQHLSQFPDIKLLFHQNQYSRSCTLISIFCDTWYKKNTRKCSNFPSPRFSFQQSKNAKLLRLFRYRFVIALFRPRAMVQPRSLLYGTNHKRHFHLSYSCSVVIM